MRIGDKEFNLRHRTYIMGILNVTPDSFSDGGKFNEFEAALVQARKLIEDGAGIIDIGGESTRPGAEYVSEEEEIKRVVTIIEAIKSELDVIISIDTYKSKVAEAAAQAGADLVNDIWGLKYDKKIAGVIAKHNVACCLMHNRKEPVYESFMQDVAADLAETLHIADKAGIAPDKILIDPGVGFGKTYEQNLQIINNVESPKVLGCPIFLATSRKSVIGLTLDVPVTERVEGTLVTTVMGVMKGCMFVRVHDIKENVRAIRMTEAILNS